MSDHFLLEQEKLLEDLTILLLERSRCNRFCSSLLDLVTIDLDLDEQRPTPPRTSKSCSPLLRAAGLFTADCASKFFSVAKSYTPGACGKFPATLFFCCCFFDREKLRARPELSNWPIIQSAPRKSLSLSSSCAQLPSFQSGKAPGTRSHVPGSAKVQERANSENFLTCRNHPPAAVRILVVDPFPRGACLAFSAARLTLIFRF